MALRNLFDPTLYLSTQQLTLRLIKHLIEQLNHNRNEQIANLKRDFQQKVLHKMTLKFRQIRKTFEEIAAYIQKKYATPQPTAKSRTLFLHELPELDPNSPDFDEKRIEFIQ
jgi:hypothetical protein